MRKLIKGKEHLILEEDQWGGYVSIEVEKLTMKMKEIFGEVSLLEASNASGLPLAAIENMTLLAYIKLDAAGKNNAGWKKHLKELRKEGFDV